MRCAYCLRLWNHNHNSYKCLLLVTLKKWKITVVEILLSSQWYRCLKWQLYNNDNAKLWGSFFFKLNLIHCDVGKARKSWRMSCDVGEVTERLENKQQNIVADTDKTTTDCHKCSSSFLSIVKSHPLKILASVLEKVRAGSCLKLFPIDCSNEALIE